MLLAALRKTYFYLPDELQRAIRVRRRSAIWLRSGILFIHIPKAAGTSINQALYGQAMGHVWARDVERWGSRALKALPSFAVTRNPWDRLVSAYRYGERLHSVDWQADPLIPKVLRGQVPRYASFGEFVTDWLQQREVTKLNAIFQPQSTFVCDRDGNRLVDHVGRVEDLGPTFEFIREHIGSGLQIERSNRSGAPVDYRRFYTPGLAEIVGRIYAQDVNRFGYSFDGE